MEYSLKNSPCEEIIKEQKMICIEQKVKDRYPLYQILQDQQIESYVTMPLFNARKKVFGHIVLMNTGPMHNLQHIENILKIYSTRVAAELERQQNEASLKAIAAKLQEAQRLSKLGNWEFNLPSRSLRWSKETFRILQQKPAQGEPDFDTFLQLVHPEDRDILRKTVRQAVEKGKSWELETRYLINGKLIYTIIKGKLLKQGNKTIKLFGTLQDVSNLKIVELDLINTTQKYQDLFENMYDALLVTNKEGRFISGNKAAQKLLEYPLSELKQQRIVDIVHPDDQARSQAFLEKLVKDGYYSNYEGRIITKNGGVKYLQVNSNAIYENGQFAGSRDIARDITQLKETEQKREQLYQELEQVNQELKNFAYIVSHDLKAPLRAIGSLAQWLAEDYSEQLGAEGQQHLDLLIKRVKRMHNFIEGILEYSRLGRIKLEKETVDFQELMNTVLDSLAPPKHFQIKLPREVPLIVCERIRIQQVFQNLISNAIKYNDKTKGKITIEYRSLAQYHEFSITDNGVGIKENHFEKVFEIFQTLQSRDQYESTGIGLTIVKRIIELHEGTIRLKSTPGEGSTFVFTLKKL